MSAAIAQGVVQVTALMAYLSRRFPGFWRAIDASFFRKQFAYALPFGVAGTLFGPPLASPYLPDAIAGRTELLDGRVLRKQREADRVLLTVSTPQGATVATFTRNAGAVDLLVAEGDTLTLALHGYAPFVDDPSIRRVRKPETPAPPAGPAAPPPGATGPETPAR